MVEGCFAHSLVPAGFQKAKTPGLRTLKPRWRLARKLVIRMTLVRPQGLQKHWHPATPNLESPSYWVFQPGSRILKVYAALCAPVTAKSEALAMTRKMRWNGSATAATETSRIRTDPGLALESLGSFRCQNHISNMQAARSGKP